MITRLGKADSPDTKTAIGKAAGFVTASAVRKDTAMTRRSGEMMCVKNSNG